MTTTSVYPQIDPFVIMTDTAHILVRRAIEDGIDAETLAQNVIENAECVVFAGFDGTEFLRIVYHTFKARAVTETADSVRLLCEAAGIIKPIYYAWLGDD